MVGHNYIHIQNTMTPVILVLLCLVARSLQCSCPQRFTQGIVCGATHVLNVTIGRAEQTPMETAYQVTVNKVFKGSSAVDDKLTITAPEESSMCGPVRLATGETYILTAFSYMNRIEVSLCDFITKAKDISSEALNGISSAYRQSCECQPPYDYELDGPVVARNLGQCGSPLSSCSWDALCEKDSSGQCNWTC